MTLLVNHLVCEGDSLSDLSQTGLTSLGSRGSTKRERLQSELAARSGGFFLQVMRAAHRRLRPSELLPSTCALTWKGLVDQQGDGSSDVVPSPCGRLLRGWGKHWRSGAWLSPLLRASKASSTTTSGPCVSHDVVGGPPASAFRVQASRRKPTHAGLCRFGASTVALSYQEGGPHQYSQALIDRGTPAPDGPLSHAREDLYIKAAPLFYLLRYACYQCVAMSCPFCALFAFSASVQG